MKAIWLCFLIAGAVYGFESYYTEPSYHYQMAEVQLRDRIGQTSRPGKILVKMNSTTGRVWVLYPGQNPGEVYWQEVPFNQRNSVLQGDIQ